MRKMRKLFVVVFAVAAYATIAYAATKRIQGGWLWVKPISNPRVSGGLDSFGAFRAHLLSEPGTNDLRRLGYTDRLIGSFRSIASRACSLSQVVELADGSKGLVRRTEHPKGVWFQRVTFGDGKQYGPVRTGFAVVSYAVVLWDIPSRKIYFAMFFTPCGNAGVVMPSHWEESIGPRPSAQPPADEVMVCLAPPCVTGLKIETEAPDGRRRSEYSPPEAGEAPPSVYWQPRVVGRVAVHTATAQTERRQGILPYVAIILAARAGKPETNISALATATGGTGGQGGVAYGGSATADGGVVEVSNTNTNTAQATNQTGVNVVVPITTDSGTATGTGSITLDAGQTVGPNPQ